jgi:hypothetical protein
MCSVTELADKVGFSFTWQHQWGLNPGPFFPEIPDYTSGAIIIPGVKLRSLFFVVVNPHQSFFSIEIGSGFLT